QRELRARSTSPDRRRRKRPSVEITGADSAVLGLLAAAAGEGNTTETLVHV
ncbi:hypothetical protein CRENBAI_024243, partial [Crenichthys baileyi]